MERKNHEKQEINENLTKDEIQKYHGNYDNKENQENNGNMEITRIRKTSRTGESQRNKLDQKDRATLVISRLFTSATVVIL